MGGGPVNAEVVRQVPPGAAGPGDVEDRVGIFTPALLGAGTPAVGVFGDEEPGGHLMARHTTFRFCIDPTVGQAELLLSRHAGAARFAFNQSLRLVKDGLTAKSIEQTVKVPWTGFDLIHTFNAWKKTEHAGRVFVVDGGAQTTVCVTGLAWRSEGMPAGVRGSRRRPGQSPHRLLGVPQGHPRGPAGRVPPV
jgi:hypothetical protein